MRLFFSLHHVQFNHNVTLRDLTPTGPAGGSVQEVELWGGGGDLNRSGPAGRRRSDPNGVKIKTKSERSLEELEHLD